MIYPGQLVSLATLATRRYSRVVVMHSTQEQQGHPVLSIATERRIPSAEVLTMAFVIVAWVAISIGLLAFGIGGARIDDTGPTAAVTEPAEG